jgi:hypothetical protein
LERVHRGGLHWRAVILGIAAPFAGGLALGALAAIAAKRVAGEAGARQTTSAPPAPAAKPTEPSDPPRWTRALTVVATAGIFVLGVVAAILLTTASAPAAAAPPQPDYGTATVDGNSGEWDTNADFFGSMYTAGNSTKQALSSGYLRYDCSTQTMYVLVLQLPGVELLSSPTGNAWVTINGASSKLYTDTSGSNGTPPDFAWVGLGDGGTATYAQGYEASFSLAPGSYTIVVHVEALPSGGTSATSAFVGFNSRLGSTPLTVDCSGVTTSTTDTTSTDPSTTGATTTADTTTADTTTADTTTTGDTTTADTTTADTTTTDATTTEDTTTAATTTEDTSTADTTTAETTTEDTTTAGTTTEGTTTAATTTDETTTAPTTTAATTTAPTTTAHTTTAHTTTAHTTTAQTTTAHTTTAQTTTAHTTTAHTTTAQTTTAHTTTAQTTTAHTTTAQTTTAHTTTAQTTTAHTTTAQTTTAHTTTAHTTTAQTTTAHTTTAHTTTARTTTARTTTARTTTAETTAAATTVAHTTTSSRLRLSRGTKLVTVALVSAHAGSGKNGRVGDPVEASFARVYRWSLTKTSLDGRRQQQSARRAVFRYAVSVRELGYHDSGWTLDGDIELDNPNDFDLRDVTLTDFVNDGGTCTVRHGRHVTMPAKRKIDLIYHCDFAHEPSPLKGIDTVKARWDAAANGTPNGEAESHTPFVFAAPTNAPTGKIVVVDSVGKLGVVVARALGPFVEKTFRYGQVVHLPGTGCRRYANSVVIRPIGRGAARIYGKRSLHAVTRYVIGCRALARKPLHSFGFTG